MRREHLKTSPWEIETLNHVVDSVNGDSFWSNYLKTINAQRSSPSCSIHLGIFRDPYLDYILDGSKTVESRFSAVRCAPHGRVSKGDVLILKQAGGVSGGICVITHVWSYVMTDEAWKYVQRAFSSALRVPDKGFWEERRHAKYATLMRIERPLALKSVPCAKRDRRGWVVLKSSEDQCQ